MNNIINIENKNGVLLVSSREVSEHFGKEHRNVVRAIEDKIQNLTAQKCSVKLSDLFKLGEYEHKGNKYKEYLLTKDGFSFMVMGFTGSKSDQWKLKYIEAFNRMEESLRNVDFVSTLALNEISELISNKLDKKIIEIEESIDAKVDSRLEDLKEYYKPTHAAKIGLCNYIKRRLDVEGFSGEYELVKRRILLMLNADKWQDISFETLLDSMNIVDNSIEVIKATRVTKQVSLFE